MLCWRNIIWPELNGLDVSDMWFQQDATYTAGQTINLFKRKLNNRVISRNGPVEWPSRSCGLTPLDYLLWGYVKSLVYTNKPRTLNELRNNIKREIANVSADMCRRGWKIDFKDLDVVNMVAVVL